MRHDDNVTGHDYTVKQHDYNVKRHDYTVKRHNYTVMISGMIINTLNKIEAKQIKLVQNFARWKQRERSL
jgi:hypothetical protein